MRQIPFPLTRWPAREVTAAAQVAAPFSRATCLTPQAGTQPWWRDAGDGPAQGSRELSHFCPQAFGQRTNTGSLPGAGPRGPAVCLGRKRTWSVGLSILTPGNLICMCLHRAVVLSKSPVLEQLRRDQTWPPRPTRTSGGTRHSRGVFVHRVWVEFLLVAGAGLLHRTPLPCWGHQVQGSLLSLSSPPRRLQALHVTKQETEALRGTFSCRLASALRSWSFCHLSSDLAFLSVTMAQPGLQGARGSF